MAKEVTAGSIQHASLSQLRYFIKGCTIEGKSGSKDLVKTAVVLLKTLPATRFAVLEYFSSIYDDKIYNLLSSNEDSLDCSQYEIIDDIQDSLLCFVQQNPAGWTPIISAWAIELLGQISTKYTNKYLQRKNLGQSASLNEILQVWMGCKATKSLIEISSECIAAMVGDTPDSCVDALLETSVKHSPHFDWVVAHIGSCFPSTIINRVLMCGLKDFCMHGGIQAESGMVTDDDSMPKFTSVVGILGHLASQHSREIKLALMTLFQTSLEDDGCELYHQGVPYILRLASSSPLLLKVITTDFIQILTVPVLNRLADLSVHWYEKGEEDNDSLLHLLVHLVMNSEYGAYKILQLLLDMAFPQDKESMDSSKSTESQKQAISPAVQRTAKQLLQLVCSDLMKVVKSHGMPGTAAGGGSSQSFTADILLLKGLQSHVSGITRMMSASQGERLEWLYQIVKCLTFSSGEGQASKILCDILMYSKSTQHIPFFLDLQEDIQIKLPSILEQTLENLLQVVQTTSKEERKIQALKSVLSVVKWENSKSQSTKITRCTLTATLESHLDTLTALLCDNNNTVASTSLLILNYTPLPKMLPVFSVVTMCNAVVTYLFRLLKAIDQDKVEMCTACKQCILRLCNYPAGQKTILRLLLETVLSKECGACVGAKPIASITTTTAAFTPTTDDMETDSGRPTVGLLDSNRSLAGIPNRVSHGGIIGQGLRANKKQTVLSQNEIYQNKPLFLNILWSVASHGNLVNTKSDNAMDTSSSSSTSRDDLVLNAPIARFIALLLIEFVTPDVMYNGIPWTEEEFMKVTIERDLLIKKRFDENPILWDIFDFLSSAPGAMCYCSAILRGITATLLYHWDSCRDSKAANSPKQYEATCRVITYMRKGNFLPPPLSYCGELLPYLSPYEVYLVLSNIWKYMKENPPVPEERNWTEIGIDRKYLDTIRPIFLSKIDQLGYLYGRFFSVKNSTT